MRSRAFDGPDDLILMQDLVRERWRAWRAGVPAPGIHVGDLDWWTALFPEERDQRRAIRLWFAAGRDAPVAWAWMSKPAELDFQAHPSALREALPHIVEWFGSQIGPDRGDPPREAATGGLWAFLPDPVTEEVLGALGYAAVVGDRSLVHTVKVVAPTPSHQPSVPPGYRLRPVGDDADDHRRRVEVHRAAFAPSRFTAERYATVRRAASYRPDLDIVVESPDGSFAAFCLCWLDEENGVGELEPVGTHPDHRRNGLASAACEGALAALARCGADTAVVYHHPGGAAEALYRSLGFVRFGRSVRFERRK